MTKPKCVVCGKEITGRYWLDEWGNCSCFEHGYRSCFACHRTIGRYSTLSPKTGQIGFKVDDERNVCALCQETCVNTRKELDSSVEFVIKLLGRAGFKIVKEGIKSITVVTQEEMKKMSPTAEGLCRLWINSNDPKQSTAEIFVLNGMPKIKLESVLAHEMLHFWLGYNGVDGGEQEEGFCNIGGALVLSYYVSRSGSSLAEHLKKDANTNTDYYYGVKFIEQKMKLQKLGWKKYINDILTTKKIKP